MSTNEYRLLGKIILDKEIVPFNPVDAPLVNSLVEIIKELLEEKRKLAEELKEG
jgi:hypothetical protein